MKTTGTRRASKTAKLRTKRAAKKAPASSPNKPGKAAKATRRPTLKKPPSVTRTFAFRALLDEVRPEVERRLKAIWSKKHKELAGHGPDVAHMVEAARDLTLRGGKRFRAGLLVAAYRGVRPRAAIGVAYDACVAMELLQTYLLIQDDWMDGDRARRGGPSAHVALSKTMGDAGRGAVAAILASDLTWGMALEVLSNLSVDPARRVEAIKAFCEFHQDVVVGQQLDTMGTSKDVELIHRLKTSSYTVVGPFRVGAILAGADPKTLKALLRFAEPLGLAFQLRDDINGAFASAAAAGRPPGSDIRSGKHTALITEAQHRFSSKERQAFARAFGKAQASASSVRAATTALETSGARAAVTARLWARCDQAVERAASLPIAMGAQLELAGAAEVLRVLPSLSGSHPGGRFAKPRPRGPSKKK